MRTELILFFRNFSKAPNAPIYNVECCYDQRILKCEGCGMMQKKPDLSNIRKFVWTDKRTPEEVRQYPCRDSNGSPPKQAGSVTT